MSEKIKHHYYFNKNKILTLTTEEHNLVHSLEGVLFTPYAPKAAAKIRKEITKLKKCHKYIKAYRLKRILKLYVNGSEDYLYKLYERGSKLKVYLGRQNGKSHFSNCVWLKIQYKQLLKKHKYIKPYRLKKIIKKYNEV